MLFLLQVVHATIKTLIYANLQEDCKILSLSICIPRCFSQDFKAVLSDSTGLYRLFLDNKSDEIEDILELASDTYLRFKSYDLFTVRVGVGTEGYKLQFYYGDTSVDRSFSFKASDLVEKCYWEMYCYCPAFVLSKLESDKLFLENILNYEINNDSYKNNIKNEPYKNNITPVLIKLSKNRLMTLNKIYSMISVRGEFYKAKDVPFLAQRQYRDTRKYILYIISNNMAYLMNEIFRFEVEMNELRSLYTIYGNEYENEYVLKSRDKDKSLQHLSTEYIEKTIEDNDNIISRKLEVLEIPEKLI